MKKLFLSLLVVFSFNAFADCQVYIPEKTFVHNSGYTVSFDFYALLEPKGYSEVYYEEDADFILNIKGTEVAGRFHKAQAEITMGPHKAVHTVTCFTQMCAVSDYAKAFNKAYQKMKKALPRCQ